jgi:UDP-N-acetylmuramate--alanine ligase
MHVYFSGIGGTGIGPLSLIAHQAGYTVSGSDKQDSNYIAYLRAHGIENIHIGQRYESIAEVHAQSPIDWFVYSSAITKEQADAPELRFCKDQGIKTTKRDAFLSAFLKEKGLKLIAVAGTHGKTTTTSMAIWLFKEMGIPASYSVGAKLSFGEMGAYELTSDYFIYEADEFDRNFLAFTPHMSLITGIDWDHHDIYLTREAYYEAFREFLQQSRTSILWQQDATRLGIQSQAQRIIVHEDDPAIAAMLHLPGEVNRLDAWLVAQAVHALTKRPVEELVQHLNRFPGVSRRFEQIVPNLYTDYAHTPPKIRGALQLAHEIAGDNVVVVYEGLHNTRQHFIKDELRHLFDTVKELYIVPSYLAREDPALTTLMPPDLKALLSSETQARTVPAALDNDLKIAIQKHLDAGNLVVCISAGGGGSLDEWVRTAFQ